MADRITTLAKAINEYLMNSTELRPQPSFYALCALINSAVMVRSGARHDENVAAIPLSSGSVAELYIEPTARCFGDFDTMYHFSDTLAIPGGRPLPVRLPDYFHDNVDVYEITESHIPCYVYLISKYQMRRRADMTYSWETSHDDGDERLFLSHGSPDASCQHGPAIVNPLASHANVITGRRDEPDTYVMSLDWVYSVRCLEWPQQASGWPVRYRPHGYPDPATVGSIVADGCDLVPVAHRLCRDDPCMAECQWRLSFSRPEVKLINNWTPMQQIVYHILKTVMKLVGITGDNNESVLGKYRILRTLLKFLGITGDSDDTVLSNYHIKTLMLWMTELQPTDWWTDIIQVSARLLDTLADWLQQGVCQHYFVDGSNLLLLTKDQYKRVDSVLTRLRNVAQVTHLTTLLYHEYIRPCVLKICPSDIAQLFDNDLHIEEGLSAVVIWRCSELQEKSWRALDSSSHAIERFVYEMTITPRVCDWILNNLRDVEPRLIHHFIGVANLHVAYKLSTGDTSGLDYGDQLLDVLAVLHSSTSGGQLWQQRRQTSMTKAGVLLKAITHRSDWRSSDEQVIQVEVCKAYLYNESASASSLSSLAHAYLAALLFAEERYSLAMHHCTVVQTSSAMSYLQAELVPETTDVHIAVGLACLYDFVTTSGLSQARYFGIISSNLFASYLQIMCITRQPDDARKQPALCGALVRYKRHFLSSINPFLCDLLLFKLISAVNQQLVVPEAQVLVYERETRICEMKWNSSKLVDRLTKSAVQRMTLFREIELQDFGSDIVSETTDFLAIDAFRRRCYRHCMQLCQQNIDSLANSYIVQEIFMLPEFIFLMGDCDLVSLLGLIFMVRPEARNELECQFSLRLTQLSLSLYLYIESQLRLPHTATSLIDSQECANKAGKRSPPHSLLNHWTLQLLNNKIIDRLQNEFLF